MRNGARSRRAVFEAAAAAIIIIGIISCSTFVQGRKPIVGPDENGVCRSVTVRNRVSKLSERLRGCRVIEGSLQVALMERNPKEAFDNLTFPDLVEITQYLAVYRVYKLTSLGKLFPNLTIIRGTQLIGNAALAIHDNPDLEEIGLYSLTHIQSGSIMIQKNPKLCFADSIDWDFIYRPNNTETYYDIHIQQNGLFKDCWNMERTCQKCPEKHCWSEGRCQIMKMDCHPLCAGGCREPNNPDACKVCKGVLTLEKKCVESCPNGSLNFMKRACITEEDCLGRDFYYRRKGWFLFVVFNGSCIIHNDCPSRYKLDIPAKGCVPCNGTCKEICTPSAEDYEMGVYRMTSISETSLLASCTHINGSVALIGLSNTFFSGVQEVLEYNLGMIEEITGQLKIMHSHGLTSLNFLSGLRVIRGDTRRTPQRIGNEDEFVPHTLVIKDNRNLQSMWDWERVTKAGGLRIENGSVLFQENPKLCLSVIEEMIVKTNVSGVQDSDLSPESNGNEAFCNSDPFNVTVEERTPYRVVVALHRAAMPGRYFIYYRRKTGTVLNMTEIYVSLGQCDDSDYQWQVTQDAEMGPNSGAHYFVLEPLQPAVDYVYFVRSLFSRMATSVVYNVTTLPAQPSPPLNFHVNATTDSSMLLNWSPPYFPHGRIEYYFIRGYYQTDRLADLLERDYCKDKLKNEPWEARSDALLRTTTTTTTTSAPNSTASANTTTSDQNSTQLLTATIDEPTTIITNSTTLASNKVAKKLDDNCIPCEDLVHVVREPKNVTATQAEAKLETRVEMCNKYEQEGYVTLSKRPEQGLELCDAYIHHLVERGQRLVAAPTDVASKEERRPPASDEDRIQPEEWRKGADGRYEEFSFVVDARSNATTITNLRHFSLYVVTIKACPDRRSGVPCSRDSILTARTRPGENADQLDVDRVNVTMQNRTALISWEEPSVVNSFVHSYVLSYRSQERENMEFTDVCVTAKRFHELNRTYTLPKLASEQYEIQLKAISLHGEGPPITTYFAVESLTQRPMSPTAIIVVLVALIVATVCFVFVFLRFSGPKHILYATVNPKYQPVHYFDKSWEVPRKKLTLIKELDRGNFGVVYEAKLEPNGPRCAAKTLGSTCSQTEDSGFLREAAIMKEFTQAFHVVKLLGVVTKGRPVYVIMEMMEGGDLKKFLVSRRFNPEKPDEPELPLSDSEQLKMAAEIADGMCFLERRKFVHRDLAARNCMVNADGVVKIGDFGMARDIYQTDYYRLDGRATLPVRWLAPESLNDGLYSSKSDMWSYGVTLWEIVMLGETPFERECPLNDPKIIEYLKDKNTRLKIPNNANKVLKELMNRCWERNVNRRPGFRKILTILDPHVDSDDFRKVSYFHNGEDVKVPSSVAPPVKSIDSDEKTEIDLDLDETPSPSDASTSDAKFWKSFSVIPELNESSV